jgi:hypothetical protein
MVVQVALLALVVPVVHLMVPLVPVVPVVPLVLVVHQLPVVRVVRVDQQRLMAQERHPDKNLLEYNLYWPLRNLIVFEFQRYQTNFLDLYC